MRVVPYHQKASFLPTQRGVKLANHAPGSKPVQFNGLAGTACHAAKEVICFTGSAGVYVTGMMTKLIPGGGLVNFLLNAVTRFYYRNEADKFHASCTKFINKICR